jgi:hypothetical protein
MKQTLMEASTIDADPSVVLLSADKTDFFNINPFHNPATVLLIKKQFQ